MLTDPIADMLTRIRNGKDQKFASVEMPASKLKMEILRILKAEGYIKNFVIRKRKGINYIKVYLKYTEDNSPSFDHLVRNSKPGRRIYVDQNDIPLIAGGRGMAVISTSQGLMTGKEARSKGIGGEFICSIW